METKLKRLEKLIFKHENIIIYGAGTHAKPVLSWLKDNKGIKGKEIHIAVSNPKRNEKFCGYKVKKINDLEIIKNKAIVLVAVFDAYFKDIDANLERLGFSTYIHVGDWFVDEAFYQRFCGEPLQNNKILVENFHGLGYGDNPKYIVEELLKQNNTLDIVWIKKYGIECEVPEGVRTVEIYTRQFFYEVSTAKIWISNVRKYQSIKKRLGQFYIQTWHGFTLKRIERDAEMVSNGISAPYFDAGKKDSQMIDILISNSKFLTRIFRQTFWYNGKILECGTPRNDIFFGQNKEYIRDKIREYYHIDKEKCILLYAPTFRNCYEENPFDIDMEKVLEALKKKTNNDWVIMLRMHPNIANKADVFQYSARVIDATCYADVMELLYAADALITDYSSIMFDYMYKKKPIFLYAKDKLRYANKDRGFYLEYESLPFPISASNEELLRHIQEFEKSSYLQKIDAFMKKLEFCDTGKASQTIAEIILEKIKE